METKPKPAKAEGALGVSVVAPDSDSWDGLGLIRIEFKCSSALVCASGVYYSCAFAFVHVGYVCCARVWVCSCCLCVLDVLFGIVALCVHCRRRVWFCVSCVLFFVLSSQHGEPGVGYNS